ncbi:MAG TPA: hypothetical protein VMB81_07620 [Candidatus Sulfotelmatobacter sp.]|nr:hypothetical protein [Candidatus Sulfotelmatobacter sp.]
MKLFVIEGYDGTDDAVAHFRVHADTRAQAMTLVRARTLGHYCGWFEVVDELDKFEVDEPGVVDEGTGPDISTS